MITEKTIARDGWGGISCSFQHLLAYSSVRPGLPPLRRGEQIESLLLASIWMFLLGQIALKSWIHQLPTAGTVTNCPTRELKWRVLFFVPWKTKAHNSWAIGNFLLNRTAVKSKTLPRPATSEGHFECFDGKWWGHRGMKSFLAYKQAMFFGAGLGNMWGSWYYWAAPTIHISQHSQAWRMSWNAVLTRFWTATLSSSLLDSIFSHFTCPYDTRDTMLSLLKGAMFCKNATVGYQIKSGKETPLILYFLSLHVESDFFGTNHLVSLVTNSDLGN